MADETEVKPTPDPTVLTTEQLLREVTTLKEWADAKDVGLGDKIGSLKELMLEKFDAIDKRQDLTEAQRLELKLDTEKALTAALQAAKEAVSEQNQSNTLAINKSETGMKELIATNAQVSKATTDALTEKIDDLKMAVARIDTQRTVVAEQKTEQRAVTGAQIALISLGVVIVLGVISAVLTLLLQ